MRKILSVFLMLSGLAVSVYAQGWACYGNGDVWIHKVGQSPVKINDNGQHACFSRDGKLVFFNRGSDVYAVKNDGTGEKKMGTSQTGSGATFCAYRPEPQSVMVRQDGSDFYKIDYATLTKTLVVETNSSSIYGEVAISDDGTRMAARLGSPAALEIKSDKTGTWSSQLGNCSASISPNGERVTRNGNNHTDMSIRLFTNLSSGTTLNNTAGGTWDNQRYSVNSNDHIAVLFDNGVGTNKGSAVGFQQVSTNKTTRVGNVSGSNTQYPDFWLGELPDPGSTAISHDLTIAPNAKCNASIISSLMLSSGSVDFSLPFTGEYTASLVIPNGQCAATVTGSAPAAVSLPLSPNASACYLLNVTTGSDSYTQKLLVR